MKLDIQYFRIFLITYYFLKKQYITYVNNTVPILVLLTKILFKVILNTFKTNFTKCHNVGANKYALGCALVHFMNEICSLKKMIESRNESAYKCYRVKYFHWRSTFIQKKNTFFNII